MVILPGDVKIIQNAHLENVKILTGYEFIYGTVHTTMWQYYANEKWKIKN